MSKQNVSFKASNPRGRLARFGDSGFLVAGSYCELGSEIAWGVVAGSSDVRFQNKGELLPAKRAVNSRENSGFSRDRTTRSSLLPTVYGLLLACSQPTNTLSGH